MAVLPVYYLFLYLPPKYKDGRTEKDWRAYHFCMAVKYGTLREKSRFSINVNGKDTKFDASNAPKCRELFGQWLGELATKHCGGEAVVIPVPSKDALIGATGTSRSFGMVTAACAGQKNLTALDAIRFKKELPKASTEKGTRDAEVLYEAMEVIAEAPKKKAILVDDIYTTGAHLKAALKRLEEAGYEVVFGVVCGNTIHETGVESKPGLFDLDKELKPHHGFEAIDLKDLGF